MANSNKRLSSAPGARQAMPHTKEQKGQLRLARKARKAEGSFAPEGVAGLEHDRQRCAAYRARKAWPA